MKTPEALAALGEYAADQWGMVTTAQAARAGVDTTMLHRLTDKGHLHPVRRAVYALATAAISPHRDVQAAWLAFNPSVPAWERPKLDPAGAVVSHRTAASVHGFGDMFVDSIELTVPRRRESRDPQLRLRQLRHRALTEDDVMLVDGLPVTTAVRTVEDLLDDHVDGSHVAEVIKDAYRTGQLDLADLDQRVGPYARRYGVKSLDGADLVDYLLEQGGTSRDGLARRAVQGTGLPSGALLGPVMRKAFEGLDTSAVMRKAFEGVRLPSLRVFESPEVQKRLADQLGVAAARRQLEKSLTELAAQPVDQDPTTDRRHTELPSARGTNVPGPNDDEDE